MLGVLCAAAMLAGAAGSAWAQSADYVFVPPAVKAENVCTIGGAGVGVATECVTPQQNVLGVMLYELATGRLPWLGDSLMALAMDLGDGHVLTTASAGALTGNGPWTGALIAAGTYTCGPDLRGTMD